MNAIYYYGFIVSFLFGIILFQKTDISFSSLTFFLLLSILILVLYFKNQNIDKKVLVFLLITSIGLSLGFLRINIYTNSQTPILTKYASEKIELDGIIKSEPDKRENSTIYTVSLDNLGENPKENIRIIMGRYPEFKYGDKVSVFGTIKIPENFENENGIEFDYIDFLEKDNIYSQMYYPSVSVIKENQASKIKKSLFSLKESFMNKLKENIPSPYAEFAGGLLLGVKQSLGKSLLNDFRIVGLIHIVVLSGYNISIIAEAIRKGLGFLNKNISIGISVLLIILFVLMVGGGATIVRAGIMTLLVLFTEVINRRYSVNRALFMVGLVMIIYNPRILLSDPGFQLSFMATIGLINLSPLIEKIIKWIPSFFELRTIVSATVATQIAVLPLLIGMTGEISVVALVVNILVLPLIPFVMLTSFITIIFSYIFSPIATVFAYISYLILSYILKIVEVFSDLDFAVYVF